jgi:hypothetical protein
MSPVPRSKEGEHGKWSMQPGGCRRPFHHAKRFVDHHWEERALVESFRCGLTPLLCSAPGLPICDDNTSLQMKVRNRNELRHNE